MKEDSVETASTIATTVCRDLSMLFQDLGKRKVTANFSGGQLSCDGGAMLQRQFDLGKHLSERVAKCFKDYRNPRFVEHSVSELVAQRIQALALG